MSAVEGLEPGVVVAGKYRIVRVLGEGGMAVVFLAEHLKLGHLVAIKVLRRELASDAGVVERFEREGRALCKLKSRNVVRAFDVDVTPSGAPLLVMEYLEGRDAEEELRRVGTLPVAEVVSWIVQACGAIQEAHDAGIVHRDLKPTNLFLAIEGATRVLKVLDFGIAGTTARPGDERLTQAGALVGTPLYMAPEQFRVGTEVDARADVWSLGATLYELLSGRPPFRGTPTTLGVTILTEEAPPIESLRLDLPEGLRAVVRRALEKDRDKRYQSARALAEALSPYQESRGLPRVTASSVHDAIASARTLVASSPASGEVSGAAIPGAGKRPRGAIVWGATGLAIACVIVAGGVLALRGTAAAPSASSGSVVSAGAIMAPPGESASAPAPAPAPTSPAVDAQSSPSVPSPSPGVPAPPAPKSAARPQRPPPPASAAPPAKPSASASGHPLFFPR